MISYLFFDLDDTLLWDKKSIKQAFVRTCQLVEEKYAIDAEQFEEAVRNEARELYASYETYPFTQMIGINPFEGLWGDFTDDHKTFQALGEIAPFYQKEAWTRGLKSFEIDDTTFAEYLAKQFPIERQKHPFVYEETFDVLDQLKKQGYHLLLLTNGAPSLQNKKLSITPELAEYFDHIIISGDFGRGKPDPDIFDYAVEKAKISKDEVIMVGDNLMTDILGSNRAGIKNIWINRESKPKNDVIPTYEIDHLQKIFPILDKLNH
ncbi:HAD family hydrolase [Aquibacillus sediminis]|uniref:HAD family hydrolase n=1 Tax=Aquibacillus sediminis TaxID=2574734 RepID=UPI00110998CF|nr:HAD family hydrolase [Aquibacillus sediminis]